MPEVAGLFLFVVDVVSAKVCFRRESFGMSHIVMIETEVRDVAAVRAACEWLRLPEPRHRTVTLFSGEATGWAVELPEWRYPVVYDLASGRMLCDNFNSRWGEQRHLDAFLQRYAIEKTRIEARRQGHSVTEQSLADGSVKLTVHVGSRV